MIKNSQTNFILHHARQKNSTALTFECGYWDESDESVKLVGRILILISPPRKPHPNAERNISAEGNNLLGERTTNGP